MSKKCHICGMVKKTTFNCKKCGKRACLACYNFTDNLCSVCEVIVYNENYSEKIMGYENDKKSIA